MHPVNYNDFAGSPTLLLSSQQHPFDKASSYAHSYPYHTYISIMPPSTPGSGSGSDPPRPPGLSTGVSPNSSRKRTRNVNLGMSSRSSIDEDGDSDMRLAPARTPTISPEPAHNENMEAINPMTGRQGQAGSLQWVESTLAERLGQGEGSEELVDQMDGAGSQRAKRTRQEEPFKIIDFATAAPSTQSPSTEFEPEPIDFYTRELGVGWSKPRDDPHVQAATRGLARFIENNYRISSVEILAKGASVDSWLVKASEGFYLFNDEMNEGRLIAADFDTTMTKLKSPNIQFDGARPVSPVATHIDSAKGKETEISEMEVLDATDETMEMRD